MYFKFIVLPWNMCTNPSAFELFLKNGVLCASFFCDIGLREITTIFSENHHTKNNQNIPKVKFITAKSQRTSHCFSSFYQNFFQHCTRKHNNYMQTIQWHHYSQSNRTIAFITEQKSLATARPFQEPNLQGNAQKVVRDTYQSHIHVSLFKTCRYLSKDWLSVH